MVLFRNAPTNNAIARSKRQDDCHDNIKQQSTSATILRLHIPGERS
ncbi:MAG: hypothetical protein IGS49_06765 [Chlorogloeopsis fritschii C42_A2020_084]|nr:hypothetical protein [Chlorogloeopsis fritschii]MBF2005163.1 hypothetical protein [Chlorogloeopsis fritschii C42_A2020_084]